MRVVRAELFSSRFIFRPPQTARTRRADAAGGGTSGRLSSLPDNGDVNKAATATLLALFPTTSPGAFALAPLNRFAKIHSWPDR